MLSLLFCDDDPFFLDLIRSLTETLLTEHSLPARCIGTAASPEQALRLRRHHPGPCLLFLDLDLGTGRLNGIDLARRLHTEPGTADTRIVFLTGHRERAMEILQSGTEPYGFLEKHTDLSRLADRIEKVLRMALRETCPGMEPTDTVRLTVQGEEVCLPVRDILYVETDKRLSHGITYHTAGGSVLTILGTLEKEQARLGDGFRRIHRSYLVQLSHMASLRGGELILSDGTALSCPLPMRKEVKRWLDEH